MNSKILITAASTLAFAIVGCSSLSNKPSKSVHQVMEEGFEGKESLNARVTKGQGTPTEIQHLAALVHQMALNAPPRGDLASWTEKTVALDKAAADLVAGKPGAMDAYKAAVNCKACHSAHKPEKH